MKNALLIILITPFLALNTTGQSVSETLAALNKDFTVFKYGSSIDNKVTVSYSEREIIITTLTWKPSKGASLLSNDGKWQNENVDVIKIRDVSAIIPSRKSSSVSFRTSKNGIKQTEYNINGGVYKTEYLSKKTYYPSVIVGSTDGLKEMVNLLKHLVFMVQNGTSGHPMSRLLNDPSYEKNYHNSLKLKLIGKRVNGKKQGVWKWFRPDGTLSSTTTYSNDRIQGECNEYYSNGELKSKRILDGNVITHIQESYSPKGKQTLFDGNGVHKTYHKNGKVRFECNMKNGKRDGVAKWYYENGKLKKSTRYKRTENSIDFAGLRWEAVSSFDEKGKQRDPGTLKNGNGTLISYRSSGKIKEVDTYRNGVEVKPGSSQPVTKPYKKYYEDGKLKIDGQMLDDKRVGVWKRYNEAGTLTVEMNFFDGENRSESKEYYANGKIKAITSFVNEKFHGTVVSYHPNGQMMSEVFYKEGKVFDPATGLNDVLYESFYPNGNLERSGRLKDEGESHGEWSYYHENGKIKTKGQEEKNEKVGKWELYNTAGELISYQTYRSGALMSEEKVDRNNEAFHTNVAKNEPGISGQEPSSTTRSTDPKKSQVEIIRIEASEDYTIVRIKVQPKDRERVSGILHCPDSYQAYDLKRSDGKTYDLLFQKGCDCDRQYYITKDRPLQTSLYFPAVNDKLDYTFSLIEGQCRQECWNVYNFKIE